MLLFPGHAPISPQINCGDKQIVSDTYAEQSPLAAEKAESPAQTDVTLTSAPLPSA